MSTEDPRGNPGWLGAHQRRLRNCAHCEYIEGMKQNLLFIATVSLTAGLSIGCCAQEPATADTTQMSREEWQAHVSASRERLDSDAARGQKLCSAAA